VRAATIWLLALGGLVGGASPVPAQDQPDSTGPATLEPSAADSTDPSVPDDEGGRVLGLIPDNKIVPSTSKLEEPLTSGGKFNLALKDTIDPFTFVLAGFYSGIAQWRGDYPAYGEGGTGYAKRFGAAYADQAIGNYLTEAIVPSLTHEDPRYFRKGTGGVWSRMSYALTRTLVTRTDKGGHSFNFSEIAGNAIAAGLSDFYYPPAQRTAGAATERLGIQVVSDSAFNVLLEFWPDMKRAILKR